MQTVVVACDDYIPDVVPVFLEAVQIYWEDAWPVEVIGETLLADEVPTCLVGPARVGGRDTRIADLVYRFLNNCEHDIFLLMLCDHIVYAEPVISEDLNRVWRSMERDPQLGCVVVYGHKHPDRFYDGFIGEYWKSRVDYVFHPTMWRREILQKALLGEKFRKFGTYHPPIRYVNLMGDGQVRGSALHGLREQGFPLCDRVEKMLKGRLM